MPSAPSPLNMSRSSGHGEIPSTAWKGFKKWQWWRYYFLNVETIAFVVIVILFIYFIWKSRKESTGETYEFQGLDGEGIDLSIPQSRKAKKKTKKPRDYGKTERKCRKILESIYGVEFRSIRPKWLRNPVTGKNLEIDCFNNDVITPIGRGLGLEYDGQQHSKYTPHFHTHGESEFAYQVKKDTWKDLKCKAEGVVLIRVPHFVHKSDLERYITMRLRKEGVLPDQTGWRPH